MLPTENSDLQTTQLTLLAAAHAIEHVRPLYPWLFDYERQLEECFNMLVAIATDLSTPDSVTARCKPYVT